ncbi:MAG: sigma-70 family RNA polymerase sigma factor, partial [Leptonema sp. (in: Bacteria)]|nr:sigma-70 family RNA polymerase sigma factor [Leptonema sp. (in: bacteria)]
MSPEEQKNLLQRVANGDQLAFMELVEPFQERLFRKACTMLGSTDDAEDALQDALLTSYRAIQRFRGESSIYTWLYRILVNRCTDLIRKRSTNKVDYVDPISFDIEDSSNLEKNHELFEHTDYLIQQIRSMEPKFAELLWMRYFDELSYEEISDVLNLKVGTVKSRLFKARELLKRRIFQDGGGRNLFGSP